MATGVAPLEGAIDFNFREAINALTHSSADAAMLASRWYDLCDTEHELDVTVSLSSGQSMTVPNLGKAVAALKRRNGDIDATSVSVHGANRGADITVDGVDVGHTGEHFANGLPRSQHSYKTPYNEYYDCGYISGDATWHDTFEFFKVPRFIFFNVDSSLDGAMQHTVSVKPIPASASLLKGRTDKYAPMLATQFTVVNADPARTVRIALTGDQGGTQVLLTVAIAPGGHADFIAWGQRGADMAAIAQL